MGDLSMQNSEWFDWMDRNTKASLVLALPVFMSEILLRIFDYDTTDLEGLFTAILLIPFAVGSIWYAIKSRSKIFSATIFLTMGFWLFASCIFLLMIVFDFSILPIPGSHLD